MKKLALCMTVMLACGCFATSAAARKSSAATHHNFIQPASAETWSGAYFGLDVAAGGGDVSGTYTLSENENESISNSTSYRHILRSGSNTLSGQVEGSNADLFVGYNLYLPRMPRVLLGIQLEGTFFSDIIFDQSGGIVRYAVRSDTANLLREATSGIANQQNLTSMFSLDLRAGFLVNPSFLMYLIGGGTEGNFQVNSDNFGILFTAFSGSDDGSVDANTGGIFKGGQWNVGYNVGAGLEYRFNPNWSMRGEYRYINFNSIHNKQDSFFGNNQDRQASSTTETLDTQFNFNTGRVAVVYRFV